jgi:hypothetical protein
MNKQVFAAAAVLLVVGAGSAARSQELGGAGRNDHPDCVFDGGGAGARPQLMLRSQTSSLWRLQQSGYSMYLRFYADGAVIGVSSTGTPAQIRPWFRAPYNDNGRYLVRGPRISFSLTSPAGRVDYDGVIDGSRLQLLSCSRINGRRSTDFYDRVPDR